MMQLLYSKTTQILLLLIVIGTFLRFYNLNWGSPFYFHPDERNIASSVSQLYLPNSMNPHFFAYGSFPLYAIFFTGLPYSLMTYCKEMPICTVHFEDALFIGRIYSAIFSTALIPLLYYLGKHLFSKRAGLIAAALGTFTTGLIQFSHFATFEIWSTFFSTVVFFFSITFLEKPTKKTLLFLALATGALVSIKATNLLLLPVPFLAILFSLLHQKKKTRLSSQFLRFLLSGAFLLLITVLFYMTTNPFVFLDFSSFHNSMNYESSVALGTLPVFYTGEFFGTIPVIFQFVKVFPFLLNPLSTSLAILGFFYGVYIVFKTRSAALFLLLLGTVLLLFPQSFFFVKWTRYMVPTLPFLILLIAFLLERILTSKKNKKIALILSVATVAISCLFGVSYTSTAFIEKDTRVQASEFAAKRLPSGTPMLADIYDMGIVPFNDHFHAIALFNYYDLDNMNPEATPDVLSQKLLQDDYLILPSQRILATRLSHQKLFPEGYKFYNRLMTDTKKFQKVYETPCSLFCEITYLGDQTFRFEGTANAFDRPPLRIYAINHE